MIHQPSNKVRRHLLLFSVAVIALLAAVAQAGTVDPTFGTSGKVTTDVNHYDGARKVFVLSDGKILVVGQSASVGFHIYSPGEMMVRYNSDGSLDTSFGTGGKVFGGASFEVRDALLQPDGKIVLAGGSNPTWNTPADDFLITRYNPNGTRDTSFGVNGYVTTSFGGGREGVNAIVLIPGGKLMAFGATGGNTSTQGTIDMARYNSDGSLDATFGTGGTLFHFYGMFSNTPSVNDALILPDGKFLMLARDEVFRFNADGSFDLSFDGDGVSSNGGGENFLLQPDGKYVIAADNGSAAAFVVTRRNPDGTPDASFGVNGTSTTRFRRPTPGFYYVDQSEIALNSNGDIYATGAVFVNGSDTEHYFGVTRLNANGSLIAKSILSFPGVPSAGGHVAFQSDGKIVLVGTVSPFESDLAVIRLVAVTNDFRPYKHPYDFDSDGTDDIAVFRPGSGGNSGVWYTLSGSSPWPTFGAAGDVIVPNDYDDDGQTDYAVFRPSNGAWYIATQKYLIPTFTTIFWGTTGDVPAAADYDGDGRADIAVYRPSNGTWYIQTNQGAGYQAVAWGIAEDRPMPGDYDGDGKADIAVYRPSTGYWYVIQSSNGQTSAVQLGASGDLPVFGDFDGDTKTDYAVYRPSTGAWFYLASGNGSFNAIYWGTAGDVVAPGDYDGDNKTDAAVFRPSTGFWYIRRSSNGAMISQKWGIATDIPIPGN